MNVYIEALFTKYVILSDLLSVKRCVVVSFTDNLQKGKLFSRVQTGNLMTIHLETNGQKASHCTFWISKPHTSFRKLTLEKLITISPLCHDDGYVVESIIHYYPDTLTWFSHQVSMTTQWKNGQQQMLSLLTHWLHPN